MRSTTQLLGAVSALALVAMTGAPAMAQGATAGSTITNDVSVSFQVGGVDQVEVTASDTFTVDRRINVLVNYTGTSPESVSPGQDRAVLAFDVTNLSNDVVDLDLSTALTNGTAANIDNFEIYLDSDGDGVLDASELNDGPITFLDEVASDLGAGTQSISVLVVADISVDAGNSDEFDIVLTANAHEGGTAGSLGTEVTATTGANTSGVDTVLFDGAGDTDAANEGDFSDTGDFVVSGAQVSVVKSSRIVSDPVNGTTNPKAVPGAVIEYCIAVSNATGAATATGVDVDDDLPADVTFAQNDFGIFVDAAATVTNGVATCDTNSGTDGEGNTAIFTAGGGTNGRDLIAGDLSDIAAGVTRALYFRVTIN